MKFISRTFGLLLIINGLLLYMHYSQSGSAASKSEKPVSYAQEIEVINRPDALYVRHHFSGLTDGRYEIVWPEASADRSCYELDATSCSRLDEQMTAITDGEITRQSIMYRIPKAGSMGETMLFTDAFAGLHGASVQSTVLHVTDETGVGGMWVNGLQRIGHKKLDLIEYSIFSGLGKVSDLYWQKESQPLSFEGKRLTVYGGTFDTEVLEEADASLKEIEVDHSTIIISKGKKSVQSPRFIVTETTDIEKVVDQFLVSSMYSRFGIPKDQPIVAEVLASILSNKGTGSDKSRSLFEELTTSLSTEEMSTYVQLLNDMQEETVDASVLDELTKTVTGYGTSFFTKNNREIKEMYPFLLEEPRQVIVAGVHEPTIRVIIKEGKMLYPAKEILSKAGFEISSNERSLYIDRDDRVLRFPLRDLFYVLNDRRFTVVAAPFEVIEGEFYFEEGWLMRLFLFDIEKKEDTIDVIPKAMH